MNGGTLKDIWYFYSKVIQSDIVVIEGWHGVLAYGHVCTCVCKELLCIDGGAVVDRSRDKYESNFHCYDSICAVSYRCKSS